MISDHDSRPWWTFRIVHDDGSDGGICHVPAETEIGARVTAQRNTYEATKKHGACPVWTWRCLGSRWATRAGLVKEAMRA